MVAQESISFVFIWYLWIALRCWLLLSLLFDEQIRELLLAATGRPKVNSHFSWKWVTFNSYKYQNWFCHVIISSRHSREKCCYGVEKHLCIQVPSTNNSQSQSPYNVHVGHSDLTNRKQSYTSIEVTSNKHGWFYVLMYMLCLLSIMYLQYSYLLHLLFAFLKYEIQYIKCLKNVTFHNSRTLKHLTLAWHSLLQSSNWTRSCFCLKGYCSRDACEVSLVKTYVINTMKVTITFYQLICSFIKWQVSNGLTGARWCSW